MSYDFEKELKKLKLEDNEHNLEALTAIKNKIINADANWSDNIALTKHANYLYQGLIDDNWRRAQCRSIVNQITKMTSGATRFLSWEVTREFIYDISLFDQTTGMIGWETKIGSRNYFSSMDFFLNAKFAYTKEYQPAPLNGRRFLFATTPTLIRQAIETKFRNMIGIKSVINKRTAKPAAVGISDILSFFKKNPKYIRLPIDIEILLSINRWSNGFVHTGIVPYSWQSLEAIDLIEPLFACKNEKMIHLEGFNYLNSKHSKEELKHDLERFFSRKGGDPIQFNFYTRAIEGTPFKS